MAGSQPHNAGPNGEQIPHGRARNHHVDHLRRRELRHTMVQMIGREVRRLRWQADDVGLSGFDCVSGEKDYRFFWVVNVIPDRHHQELGRGYNERLMPLADGAGDAVIIMAIGRPEDTGGGVSVTMNLNIGIHGGDRLILLEMYYPWNLSIIMENAHGTSISGTIYGQRPFASSQLDEETLDWFDTMVVAAMVEAEADTNSGKVVAVAIT
nr:hypothetical protein Iba_chr12cCG16390 [Ipomoea batatas]